MNEAEAMFAEEEAPDDLDDDIGDLPIDPATPRKKKKKKVKVKVKKVGSKERVMRKKRG